MREEVKGKPWDLFSGVLNGWLDWQRQKDQNDFNVLCDALKLLLPDEEYLGPGEPVKILGYDQKQPSLTFSYGQVGLLYAAASVQRIATLAYSMVWLWRNHLELSGGKTLSHMMVMIDEVEMHLHPHWVRTIMKSLKTLMERFSSQLKVQFMISTHNPLFLASLEPWFEEEKDRLFHFSFDKEQKQAVLESQLFTRKGLADYWLMSDTIGLEQARSLEGEQAIKDARALQAKAEKADPDEVQKVHKRLCNTLGDHDRFWPRWGYFAEQHGVEM